MDQVVNDNSRRTDSPRETVLVVETDVLARHAIAEYLRHCGYRVIEAARAAAARAVLLNQEIAVDIVLCAIQRDGTTDGFALATWVRKERPSLDVILAGTIEKAAAEAGSLCEQKPHLEKPYQPQQVVEWIKKLRNLRTRP